MGRKRAGQPGYIEKINARGHKYWAKDPNYNIKKIDDNDFYNDDAPLSESEVKREYDKYEHMFNDIGNWVNEGYIRTEGHTTDEGFVIVDSEIEDYGTGYIITKSPSGQCYQVEFSGYYAPFGNSTEISVTPVVEVNQTTEIKDVAIPHRKEMPNFKSSMDFWGSEHYYYEVGANPLPVSQITGVEDFKSLGHINKRKLKEFGLEDNEFIDRNTSIGDDMVPTNMYTMKYKGNEFLILSESPSEDYFGECISLDKDGNVYGDIYKITGKTKGKLKTYHHSGYSLDD